MKPEDYERMKWVQLFNKYDLYTKDGENDLRGEKMQEELWPYYKWLLEKFNLGGKLKWQVRYMQIEEQDKDVDVVLRREYRKT